MEDYANNNWRLAGDIALDLLANILSRSDKIPVAVVNVSVLCQLHATKYDFTREAATGFGHPDRRQGGDDLFGLESLENGPLSAKLVDNREEHLGLRHKRL
jgi:hypothetical protein